MVFNTYMWAVLKDQISLFFLLPHKSIELDEDSNLRLKTRNQGPEVITFHAQFNWTWNLSFLVFMSSWNFMLIWVEREKSGSGATE